MEYKRVDLESLFQKIRNLTEEYETEEFDSCVVILKSKSEEEAFTEELNAVINEFVQNELSPEESEETEEEDFMYDDDLLEFYDDDDLD